jgi:hypothetical protein
MIYFLVTDYNYNVEVYSFNTKFENSSALHKIIKLDNPQQNAYSYIQAYNCNCWSIFGAD